MRCFIAVYLPEEIKNYLYDLQHKIGDKYAKVKWVAKKNLHKTLKFLGEIDEEKLDLVKKTLNDIKFKRFEAGLNNIGWFPNDYRINIIWVDLKPERNILELHDEIELRLGNLFERDERFSVHITLGRVKYVKNKERFLDFLRNIKVMDEKLVINEFSLIKSDLSKDGPKYSILERYPLL